MRDELPTTRTLQHKTQYFAHPPLLFSWSYSGKPADTDSLLLEAKLMAKLGTHPAILRVFGVWQGSTEDVDDLGKHTHPILTLMMHPSCLMSHPLLHPLPRPLPHPTPHPLLHPTPHPLSHPLSHPTLHPLFARAAAPAGAPLPPHPSAATPTVTGRVFREAGTAVLVMEKGHTSLDQYLRSQTSPLSKHAVVKLLAGLLHGLDVCVATFCALPHLLHLFLFCPPF